MKNNLLEKDYKIEKGEVLEGSALLKKQDSNTSRVKYMIENIMLWPDIAIWSNILLSFHKTKLLFIIFFYDKI